MLILKCNKGHYINTIGGTYFFSMQVSKYVREPRIQLTLFREVGVEQRKDRTQ